MRIVLVAVALVLAGCVSAVDDPGAGVARAVPDNRARSVAEAQITAAMAALWGRPALHADIIVDGDDEPVRVERDRASGRWRAQQGIDDLDPIGSSVDPRLVRGVAWATTPDAISQLDWSGVHEALPPRAGRYGLEDGYRVATPGADTVEVWISRDSGLVTEVVLPRDGVAVAFTPLPAALVIDA